MRKRKWISVILLVCVCFQICACAAWQPQSDESKSDVQRKLQATMSTTLPSETDTDPVENDSDLFEIPSTGEFPLLTIESYDAYMAFIEKSELPHDFVQYESIAQFGEFKSFVCLSDARNNDFSSCMYSLVDDSQSEFVMYIDIGDTNKDKVQLSTITSVNNANMRVLTNKTDAGTYVVAGLKYKYVAGKLLSISWTRGAVSYTLSGNSMLGDYPESATTTAVGKMLNTHTAKVFLDALDIDETVS